MHAFVTVPQQQIWGTFFVKKVPQALPRNFQHFGWIFICFANKDPAEDLLVPGMKLGKTLLQNSFPNLASTKCKEHHFKDGLRILRELWILRITFSRFLNPSVRSEITIWSTRSSAM
jgi:hypothetical protein